MIRYLTKTKKVRCGAALVVLGCVILSLGGCKGSVDTFETSFQLGNKAMLEGNFVSAVELYEECLGLKTTGELYHNVGIAYYEIGRIGEAILSLERAAQMKIFTAKTKEILSLIRTSENLLEPEESIFQKLWNVFPVSVWVVTSVLSFWGFMYWGVYQFAFLKSNSIYRDFAVTALMFLLICCAAAFGQLQHSKMGVVVADDMVLKIVPSDAGDEIKSIDSGAVVRLISDEDKFVFVETMSGIRGWIRSDGFALIR